MLTKALTQSERLKFLEIYQSSFFIDHLWTSGVENYHQHMLQVSLAFSKSRNKFIPHYVALHQQIDWTVHTSIFCYYLVQKLLFETTH